MTDITIISKIVSFLTNINKYFLLHVRKPKYFWDNESFSGLEYIHKKFFTALDLACIQI